VRTRQGFKIDWVNAFSIFIPCVRFYTFDPYTENSCYLWFGISRVGCINTCVICIAMSSTRMHRCMWHRGFTLSIYHLVYIQILCGERLHLLFSCCRSSTSCIMFDSVSSMHSAITCFIQIFISIFFSTWFTPNPRAGCQSAKLSLTHISFTFWITIAIIKNHWAGYR